MKQYNRKPKNKIVIGLMYILFIILNLILIYDLIPIITKQGYSYINSTGNLEVITFSIILAELFILSIIRKKINSRK